MLLELARLLNESFPYATCSYTCQFWASENQAQLDKRQTEKTKTPGKNNAYISKRV